MVEVTPSKPTIEFGNLKLVLNGNQLIAIARFAKLSTSFVISKFAGRLSLFSLMYLINNQSNSKNVSIKVYKFILFS